jgi:hypothetical protein
MDAPQRVGREFESTVPLLCEDAEPQPQTESASQSEPQPIVRWKSVEE